MARKQSFTVRCDGDGCRSYEDVDSLDRLPEGWYQVGTPDGLGRVQKSDCFDLCSLPCVEKWAKARRIALGGDTKKRGYERTKKCPYCEEVFSPQGLSLHIRSNHVEEAALDAATTP